MVVDVSHAVDEFHVREVTTRVHYQGDRLETLRPAKPAGDPCRQQVLAIVGRSHGDGLGKIEPQNLVDEPPKIERFTLKYCVKRHRTAWCCTKYPTKPSMDITAAAAQSPMFQLKINRIIAPNLAANILDVFVTKFSHPTMSAAQQILVQVEHGHVENFVELLFQTTGIRGDAAQIIIGRDQGQPLTGGAAGVPKRRCADRGGGEERGMGFELDRRHDFSLPTATPTPVEADRVIARYLARSCFL